MGDYRGKPGKKRTNSHHALFNIREVLDTIKRSGDRYRNGEETDEGMKCMESTICQGESEGKIVRGREMVDIFRVYNRNARL